MARAYINAGGRVNSAGDCGGVLPRLQLGAVGERDAHGALRHDEGKHESAGSGCDGCEEREGRGIVWFEKRIGSGKKNDAREA
jgi:hypothetical protein